MTKYFYLTTPIFYPNDRLHLGHSYTMTMADIIVRYKKSQGYVVYFQTGSDDHGEKIAKKANSLGLTPQQLVDQNVLLFQQLWQELGISEHLFYRTSWPSHQVKMQKIFTKLLARDDIYLGKYRGNYCVTCEDYISEGKTNDNNLCPECSSELCPLEEPAYFLRISKYSDQLLTYYEQNPNLLLPLNVKKEQVSKFLQDDIRDLCITRRDINWGIPVPNKEGLVIYVWFEALCNYLNSEPGTRFFLTEESNNCEIIQLVGKDIARFHGIYWPIILLLQKVRLPNKILAHGWILGKGGTKMSKSLGNVVDPLALLKKYPPDLLRAYLVAKINFLQDGILTEELLREFYQDFFVNNLSNLVSRTNKMLQLYNRGVVPKFSKNEKLEKYYQECQISVVELQKDMNEYQLTKAFSHLENLLNSSNKLISDLTPWKLFQSGDQELLEQILNHLVNRIKIIGFLLNFIIPQTSNLILTAFNIDWVKLNWDNLLDFSWLNELQVKILTKHLYEKLT